MKRVIVTGVNGFLGSHLAEALMRKGYHVIGIGESPNSTIPLDEYHSASITQSEKITQIFIHPVEHIFHLAAISNVAKSIEDPDDDFRVNFFGTFNLLKIVKNLKLKSFVFSSSISVLKNSNKLPYKEEDEYGPTTPYGASKMASEAYCSAFYKTFGIPTKIVRLFNVYGPRRKGMVVPDIISKLLINQHELIIRGSGNQIRDFLYVDDAIDGLILVAESGLPGEIYNLGSGEALTIDKLSRLILTQMNLTKTILTHSEEKYNAELNNWYADISKIARIGFKQKISIEEGLNRTIAWLVDEAKRK